MAMPIANYGDFRQKFEERKYRSDLFLFFLFDQRTTHTTAEEFARENIEWLDSSAGSAGVFIFFFVRDEHNPDASRNPSLKVAAELGIKQSDLPGVALFTLDEDTDTIQNASYLKLDSKIFSLDDDEKYDVFDDLFDLIRECKSDSAGKDELIAEIRDEISRLQRREGFRPFLKYVKASIASLTDFTKDVIKSSAVAYAQAKAH